MMQSCSLLVLFLGLAAGVRPASAAACTSSDLKTWEGGAKDSMNSWMKDCILKGPPGGDWKSHCIRAFGTADKDAGKKCMSDCIQKREQFSAPCSDCFGAMSQCTFEKCAMKCLDPTAKICTDCTKQAGCVSTFETCSGINDVPNATVFLLARNQDVLAAGVRALPKPSAAELRRWDSSIDCTGKYTAENQDEMSQCTPFLIPAPASIRVEQLNDTAYASYHYQGPVDCSGTSRTLLEVLTVGTCTSYGTYSQKRVWIQGPDPSSGTCAAPGDCGLAYKACCVGSKATGHSCACHLHNGTGTAGSTDCGVCGKAYVACCSAFELKGYPCTCDINDKSGTAFVV